MAYSKTTWTDGTTPVDASNLNKIEEALEENSNLIDDINTNRAFTASYSNSLDDMWEDMRTKTNYIPFLFSCNSTLASELLGISTSNLWYGIGARVGTSVDFLLFANTYQIYWGRITDGTLNRAFYLAGSVLST